MTRSSDETSNADELSDANDTAGRCGSQSRAPSGKMTGFDAPCLHTMYADKPNRIKTIARELVSHVRKSMTID